MNTTLGLNLVNATLRIAMHCQAFNLWLEPDPAGSGFTWQGYGAWEFANIKSRVGLEYKVITELPEPEDNLYEEIMALKKNMADICIDFWGVSYQRSRHIDFSFPRDFSGIFIFSGKSDAKMKSYLVTGVFDNMSYGLIALVMILISLVFRLILGNIHQKDSLITCMLCVFGNAMKQPLQPHQIAKKLSGQLITTFFSLYSQIICLVYGSIVLSFLIAGSPPPEITSLQDLNKTENRNMRIIMVEKSYVPDLLVRSKKLIGFEHRIDYIDFTELSKPSTLHKILHGSHVLIGDTILPYLCKMNSDAGYTIANLNDFGLSRYSIIKL